MSEAFRTNPHVPMMLGMPSDGNHEEEEKIDAYRYALIAHHAWHSTEGAVDFTVETVMEALSPSMRKKVEQMAKLAEANAQ